MGVSSFYCAECQRFYEGREAWQAHNCARDWLKPGVRVRVIGLVGDAEYTGHIGTVVERKPEDGFEFMEIVEVKGIGRCFVDRWRLRLESAP